MKVPYPTIGEDVKVSLTVGQIRRLVANCLEPEPARDTSLTLTFVGMDDCDAAVLHGILREAIVNLPRDHRVWDFLGRRPLVGTINATMADPSTDNILVPPTSCPWCGTIPAYRRVPADPWDRHEVCVTCGYCYNHKADGAPPCAACGAKAGEPCGPTCIGVAAAKDKVDTPSDAPV